MANTQRQYVVRVDATMQAAELQLAIEFQRYERAMCEAGWQYAEAINAAGTRLRLKLKQY